MAYHVGFAGKFGAGTSGQAVNEQYEILSESIRKQGTHISPNGIRGVRGDQGTAVVEGNYTVGGNFVFNPRPADLDAWLPRIMGASAVMAETIPDFRITMDRGAHRWDYDGCKIARATFRSAPGQLLEVTCDVVGKTADRNTTAFPSLTLATTQPYQHRQAVLTLDSVARDCGPVELIHDNGLLTDLFFNSQTLMEIPEGPRVVTLNTSVPYDADHDDLWGLAVAGITGSLVYTNGLVSITFSFTKLQAPDRDPIITTKNGVTMLELSLIARMSGSTAEYTVTNDSNAGA